MGSEAGRPGGIPRGVRVHAGEGSGDSHLRSAAEEREGWTSLLIGLAFLAACVTIAHTLTPFMGRWNPVMKEGLTIIGWVAMWRPLEIYLYRWWPIRHLGEVFRKLGEIPVEIRVSGG